MVTALKGLNIPTNMNPPDGMFGQDITIQSGGVTISNKDLDCEFTIPFSDDLEADEAEIIIYNLSQSTISQLKYNAVITVTAGYSGDTGVIFNGRIASVKTKHVGVDKQTVIKALDANGLEDQELESIAYKSGSTAGYILKDLLGKFKVPIAKFEPRKDYTYKKAVNVEGSLKENVKKFAEMCGVTIYFNKGKLYARWITDGDNINFTVEENTGLIGSPEEFEETVTNENDEEETLHGYKVTMLLQHRITTAAIINLKSVDVSGQFRVRSGTHTFDGDNFYTEVEVI